MIYAFQILEDIDHRTLVLNSCVILHLLFIIILFATFVGGQEGEGEGEGERGREGREREREGGREGGGGRGRGDPQHLLFLSE